MRVLLAETTWASMIAARELALAGFLVSTANDGHELSEYVSLARQNVILFDADLPDMDGLEALRALRRADPNVGICVMVPDAAFDKRMRAFAMGADEVISTTCDRRELVARVQSVARRRSGLAGPQLRAGALVIDCNTRAVELGGKTLHLTRHEYEIVEMLALRSGAIVPKDDLMLQIYGLDEAPDSKIIGVYICHIRGKIVDLGGDPAIIENVRGRGYAILEQVQIARAA